MFTFEEIRRYLCKYKPDNINIEKINETCINFIKLHNLMDSIFNTIYSKQGTVTSNFII